MKLEQVFSQVLKEPEDAFSDESSPNSVTKWDSLNHIELVMTIEATYGIGFSTAEVTSMSSLGAIRDMLKQKGVEAA